MDHNAQIDYVYFLKAFDTVPHCRFLKKLEFYRKERDIICWIEKWLTACRQQVLLDVQSSEYCLCSSGVPQGTVLGPLFFLIYINNITENFKYKLFPMWIHIMLYTSINI